MTFLSTLSLRRATLISGEAARAEIISIHALLAESDRDGVCVVGLAAAISIHALLAESDQTHRQLPALPFISIHALLAESDDALDIVSPEQFIFLSTLSLRRATLEIPLLCLAIHNFYPRSPCGERRGIFTAFCVDCLFLSTLSLRRATE